MFPCSWDLFSVMYHHQHVLSAQHHTCAYLWLDKNVDRQLWSTNLGAQDNLKIAVFTGSSCFMKWLWTIYMNWFSTNAVYGLFRWTYTISNTLLLVRSTQDELILYEIHLFVVLPIFFLPCSILSLPFLSDLLLQSWLNQVSKCKFLGGFIHNPLPYWNGYVSSSKYIQESG